VHKRFDPIYVDAKDRIEALGNFSYMYAYMSQPKHQLDTFRAWAGKGSDIRYLNATMLNVHVNVILRCGRSTLMLRSAVSYVLNFSMIVAALVQSYCCRGIWTV
jgi:D-galacturonate reductase